MKSPGCITTFTNDTQIHCECCATQGIAILPLEYIGVISTTFFTSFTEISQSSYNTGTGVGTLLDNLVISLYFNVSRSQ